MDKECGDRIKWFCVARCEHHRVKTFQEEYVAFLERHEIEYDPKYLWD